MTGPATKTIVAVDLDLQRATEHRPLPGKAEFERWVEAALAGEPPKVLTLRLVDEEESRVLNRDYRGKDYPTNVLSFAADLPPEVELPLLGDIVICAPLVAAEAADQGKAPDHHWAHLTVHGVLHLLGMDHLEEEQARHMERAEIEILAGLGIANPYD